MQLSHSLLKFVRPWSFVKRRKSRQFRRLLDEKPAPVLTPDRLPRIIYLFWDDGLDSAPEITRFCYDSWVRLNPTWEIKFLDAEDAKKILDPADLPAGMRPSHYADCLRARLLHETGGVWVDMTCLCLRPLDDWLLTIFTQTDFFAFNRPGNDRKIASWFLASTRGHAVMSAWDSAIEEYWSNVKPTKAPYFWFHYLFEYIAIKDAATKSALLQMPNYSASLPHVFQRHLNKADVNPADLQAVRHAFVQKLSYKLRFGVEDVRQLMSELDMS